MKINATKFIRFIQSVGLVFFISNALAAVPPIESLTTIIKTYSEGVVPTHLLATENGDLYGLTANAPTASQPTYGMSIFKVDNAGNYQELYSSPADANYQPLQLFKGLDNKLYVLAQIWTDAKFNTQLFRLDFNGQLVTPVSLFDFPLEDGVSLSNKIHQNQDGSFSGQYNRTYFFGHHSGIYHLDLSGATPVYQQVYEYKVSTPWQRVEFFFPARNGIYYGYSVTDTDTSGQIAGASFFSLDTNKNPPEQINLHNFGNLDVRILPASNGKFYGSGYSALRGQVTNSVLFELNPAASPVSTPIQAYPTGNRFSLLLEGDNNDFYGFRDQTPFQLDVSGIMPVYKEFDGLDLSGINWKLIANSALYGAKKNIDGSPVVPAVLVKVDLSQFISPPPPNTEPVAVNDVFKLKLAGKKPSEVAAPGVLSNDTDADGDKLSVVGADATKPRIIDLPKQSGTVALYADGHFIITLAKNKPLKRQVTFSYQVTDGKAVSVPATVTLNLRKK